MGHVRINGLARTLREDRFTWHDEGFDLVLPNEAGEPDALTLLTIPPNVARSTTTGSAGVSPDDVDEKLFRADVATYPLPDVYTAR